MSNDSLSFKTLRQANALRLPQFKNRQGEICHSHPDGSDWSPAQWLQAWLGEIGELATARVLFEEGKLSYDEYSVEAKKESADAATYQDIAARRFLDTVKSGDPDAAQILMRIIAALGMYANLRKKFDRGDMPLQEFREPALVHLTEAVGHIHGLMFLGGSADVNKVDRPHPIGIDLGIAITDKFNEVSERVGCNVRISNNGVHFAPAEVDLLAPQAQETPSGVTRLVWPKAAP